MERVKTIHELRKIAQAKGIKFSFGDDATILAQKINMVNDATIPKSIPIPPRPAYDARLMNKPPAKHCNQEELNRRLEPFMALGIKLTFPDEETWHIQFAKKMDSGTMRMPVIKVIQIAEKLLA